MKRIINDINQWPALTLLVMERWRKRPKPFTVTLNAAPKSLPQLGYFYSECLPKLTEALFEAGEIRNKSENAAKYFIKRHIGYGMWYQFGDKDAVFDPDSIQRATLETLTQIIDASIDEAAKRGVTILPPRSNANN